MFNFKSDIYSDIRIENIKKINITSHSTKSEEDENGTYIRVFDGNQWYNDNINETNTFLVQDKLNKLCINISNKNKKALETYYTYLPKKSYVYSGEEYVSYANDDLIEKFVNDKVDTDSRFIIDKVYSEYYVDKQFITSTGLHHKYNHKLYGFGLKIQEASTGKSLRFMNTFLNINEMKKKLVKVPKFLEEAQDFLLKSSKVKAGKYKLLLSPEVSGLYAHECFGHLLEYDCYLSVKDYINYNINQEFSIIDDGMLNLGGYCPVDDEGMISKKTYMIRKGKISNLLHNTYTSMYEKCSPTGNARAVGFKNKPLIRMTNTYIEPSQKSLKQILSKIDKGIYIKSVNDGCFDGEFTFEPELCYEITNGCIGKPIRINKICGNIEEMYSNIITVGNDLRFTSSLFGGCDKEDQYPLMVSYGGPHILLDQIYVE